jgi:hypothetical protein
MKKATLLSVSVILSLALLSPLILTKGADDFSLPYNWRMNPLELTIIDGGAPRGVTEYNEGERVSYEYIKIGQELEPDHGVQFGPYDPYAIKVKINTVTPSGYKLTVTIKLDGAVEWSGALGAGQSSPTITCDGSSAEVSVLNLNDVTVDFTGTITLITN